MSPCALPVLSQGSDIELLKSLNASWIGSYPTKDRATLDRILAADFILINPKGVKVTKQGLLSNLQNLGIATATVDSVEVRLLGKTVGTVTGYVTFTIKSDDKEEVRRTCYLDIYEKRKGRWVAVNAHVTSLD